MECTLNEAKFPVHKYQSSVRGTNNGMHEGTVSAEAIGGSFQTFLLISAMISRGQRGWGEGNGSSIHTGIWFILTIVLLMDVLGLAQSVERKGRG